MEKTVSEAIRFRRSVRKFDPDKELNNELVKKCIENAALAPTSSNLQLWEFYHVTDKKIIEKISKSCFDQPAAKTAKQLIITVVRKDLWKLRANSNIEFFNSKKNDISRKQFKMVNNYYKKVQNHLLFQVLHI